MTQRERRQVLIRSLLAEEPRFRNLEVPEGGEEQRRLLRSLMNLRQPGEVPEEVLQVQDAYLQEEIARKGITDAGALTPTADNLCLWKGDITTLKCGAIVNAANSGMTGCYVPCHSCIDNCIHTYAGMQLRLACARLMEEQGHEEPTGQAKITPAFNLPCRWVIHTVGPIVRGGVTPEDERLLASCYRSCLELARSRGVESLAFCCISTGVFHFPARRAAEIAVETVRTFQDSTHREMRVIFNVFKNEDERIYRELLPAG